MMRVLETAACLFKHGHYEQALETVDESLASFPDSGRLWELRGLILRAIGNLPLACDSLEHAAVLIPLSLSGQLTLADCFSRLGQRGLALLVAQHLLALGQLDWSLSLHLAHVFDRCDQPGVSVEICRLVCKQNPAAHQAFFDLGYFLGRARRPAEQIEAAARHAIRLAPNHANYRVGLSVFLWQQDRSSEALEQVAPLTHEQIGAIRCACCLQKLANIYSYGLAFGQSQACIDRINELEATRPHAQDGGCCS
jgi:tetratricopeptide (TPR) repeat protein